MGRVAVTLAVLPLLLAACGSAAPMPSASTALRSDAPSPAESAGPPSEDPTPLVVPTPTTTTTPEPSPSQVAAETPLPTPPSPDGFWAAAAGAVERTGRLRIRVIGPSPGELRYEPDASATAVDGEVVFVCVDGRSFDGQSGFAEVPGPWTCGADALVHGFRLAGMPLDAWNAELASDDGIREAIELRDDGSWEWRYRATNSVFGGEIRATVVLDPASGEIRSASRSDPTGETTYGISYSEAFPSIAVP